MPGIYQKILINYIDIFPQIAYDINMKNRKWSKMEVWLDSHILKFTPFCVETYRENMFCASYAFAVYGLLALVGRVI